MSHTVSIDISGHPLSLETGKVAKQADGAVVVRYGGSMVLATCVAAKFAKESQDFFPLAVEAYLLDFSGDLYGQTVRLTFRSRVREERRFSSVDALRAQIAEDVETARRRL